MFDKIIAYSIQNKFVISLFVLALIIWGAYSLRQLPIDAVPDITNNQVQVLTTSPSLATQEVEQLITSPVEIALQNIQQLVEIRSVSRFGLSVVTVVFEEGMDTYLARQLVNENLRAAIENIPEGLGKPELAPISTGLGEIYQYVVRPEEGYEDQYSATTLRSIQDWIVRRQLSGLDGVVEVNTLGGYQKQYEVAVNPDLLKSAGVSIKDIYEALVKSNENSGGAYIEKTPNTYYIRTNGLVRSLQDIEQILVAERNGRPITVSDVAVVQFGKAPRYGALTRDGEEVVGGTVMMLKGENSAAVTERIKERVIQIQKSLPEGVVVEPYLVRDKLISTAIKTVKTNLIEGGLIVIFILVLMLGNWRAGLIVASVIPLAMLFAISLMNVFGISANLMSLGAIDFGLIVDGAVIIVEAIVHRLHTRFAGQKLTPVQMNNEVQTASQKIRSSAAFGELIILMVYIPILALVGIEGKMFKPMAQTVMFAIGGALILSLTYVPMMSALFLNKYIKDKRTISDRIIAGFQKIYTPILERALRFKYFFVFGTVLIFALSLFSYSRLGGEFIPTMEEGDFALHQILPPGSSLSQSVETSKIIQRKLQDEFPEVIDVVTKIGSSEIPTDPMPVETGDIMVILKPMDEWTSAHSRQGLFEKMEESLLKIPGVAYEFSQPIQMRFNELMTGSRADIAIKLYGEDLDLLYKKAKEAERIINLIDGVGTTKVDQTVGMPQIVIDFNYSKMAQYGLHVKDVNQVVRAAFAGEKAGTIYEGDSRFDLVIRVDEKYRNGIRDVENLYITLGNGAQVPLSEVSTVELVDAPMQISRENTKRRIVIGVNVGTTDVETLVEKIQSELDEKINLPAGYYFSYGGQFENLKAANARLAIAVPLALALIFILLFLTFGSLAQSALIFTAIPLSAIGGIWALSLRGMPFSISAGIGFIALFGVAVLNGIVLIGYFNQLKKEGMTNIRERILIGTSVRLRPVLMTAMVASFGFLPMAISTSGGAEVQRPLATVVIGGLVTATFLTLVVLPILYSWLANWQEGKSRSSISGKGLLICFPILFYGIDGNGQSREVSMEEAVEIAVLNNPLVNPANLGVQYQDALKDLSYAPGNTEFRYQGDGLFRENGQQVNQIGIVQQFPSIAGVKANNGLQEILADQSRLKQQITFQEVRKLVRDSYVNLQQRSALIELYNSFHRQYERFYRIALKRQELGAINGLEVLAIQSAKEEVLMLLNQLKVEEQNYEFQFNKLVNASEIYAVKNELLIIPFVKADNLISVPEQLAGLQIKIEQAESLVIQSSRKPGFSLGYSAQNYFEEGWLHGLEFGVQIPIFNEPLKQKIAAQEIRIQIAKSNVEVAKMQTVRELFFLEKSIKMYEEGFLFYEGQIASINIEMNRISELNYQAGSISYLELLQALNIQFNNQKKYLEQILAYNKSVINYQYLTNQ